MVQTQVQTKIMKIRDLIEATGSGFDIADVEWDMGVYFECQLKWEDCEDDYDKAMFILGNNIDVHKYQKDWYTICAISDFVKENKKQFDEFLNEVMREGFRPKDYQSLDSDTEEWYDVYIQWIGSFISGCFSESDYKLFVEIMTK